MTKQYQTHFVEEITSSSRFDTMIECLLIILLVFMPLAFGVVHAWSEEIVIAVVGVMTACFLLKLLILRHQELIWTWAYVPITLLLLVVVFQLIPLPVWLLNIISPNTVALRTELLGNLPDSETLLKSMPISLYSNGTKHDLRLLLSVTAVFVIVLNIFRRSDQIKRLLTAIALIGGLVAVITLAQNIFNTGKIYWFISSTNSKGFSGPFVNHNNYGQFINLSIGAMLALFMIRLREVFWGKKVTPTVAFELLSWRSAKLIWLLLVMISIGAATVFISLTRGGMISLIAAMAFTTVIFASQRSLKGHGWVMVAVGLLAFICILYVGYDAIYERLASIRDFRKAESSRLQILKDIAGAWTFFPILGTGLGTHTVVYPMFDQSTITALAAYAENEYAQVLEEIGLIGLGLLIILGIIVCVGFLRCIRRIERPISMAIYGLSFGLLAILIQSMADFGQHLPANAVLSAVFCALLLGLARSMQKGDRWERQILIPSSSPAVFRIIIFFGVCALWSWMLLGADNARLSETHWQKAFDMEKNLSARNWHGTDAEYTDLISKATKAVDYEPDNITYRYWLCVYRWRSLCRAIDPNLAEKVARDSSMPEIHDIVNELHKLLFICPTHGPTYSMVGQIEKFFLNDDRGTEMISRGYRLAPCNPITCFVAGWLDMQEGRIEDSVVKFERAVQLDDNLFCDVVDIYINQLSQPHLAISAAGDNIGHLSYLVEILEHMQYYDLAEKAQAKIQHLLEAKRTDPGTPGSVYAHLADIYNKQENFQVASECYRQALARDYGQIQWRMELIKILVKIGRSREALSEAKICLQLRPRFDTAERLVEDLSVQPNVVAQKDTHLED